MSAGGTFMPSSVPQLTSQNDANVQARAAGSTPQTALSQREVAKLHSPAHRRLLVTHSRQLVNERARTTRTFKDKQLGALHSLPYLRHFMQHLCQSIWLLISMHLVVEVRTRGRISLLRSTLKGEA